MNVDQKNVLIETDLAFSKLSETKGMNFAFIEYIADSGVMLRPNNMPFVGKDVVKNLFQRDDSNFTLTWKPLFADIAKSGELGYTYGTYSSVAGEVKESGTYVSIWKKDNNGKWKLVLDTGNEGLGN